MSLLFNPRCAAVWMSAVMLGTGCGSEEKLSVHNSAPTAVITSHSDGSSVLEGSTIIFLGKVSDNNDDESELITVWYINGEEACGETRAEADGTTVCMVDITATSAVGVRLQVTDSGSKVGIDEIELEVAATAAPTVSLLQPSGEDTYTAGEPILFSAAVNDAEDAPPDLSVWFESSRDGRIEISDVPDSGGGLSGSIMLTAGLHDLALWAQDSDGKTGKASVTLTVDEVTDEPPTAEIVSPVLGEAYYAETTILFSGLAGDTEDDPSALTGTWSSSIDGDLPLTVTIASDGTTDSYGTLSVGEHVLTFTVTDSAMQTAVDTVLINVSEANTAPNCLITAPEDAAFVAVDQPVTLEGEATDTELSAALLTVEWSSDRVGVLDTTPPSSTGTLNFETEALDLGAHTITLTVTDDLGLSCTESITLNASNAPDLVVEAPLDG